ncbi:DNA repair ATPase [Chitinophaga japonensis]|uniref:ATPase family protein associated with various cellular activities (AAA) n=1 Tax=Chitinophaga japonensis TaxID=104662 RepID=A0A562SZE4_CHIJA|nr:DNA repair ATPase [Chitinophaga japonensis]TWI86374.1 ATPase family protein associated with various cellular activities (AAA) [Chitinophaga japonensis]
MNTPDKHILDSGTYEIIRNRLNEQRLDLEQRLARLNAARKDIFNSSGFQLIANQRITTENSGVARGIMALGDLAIFAYNVHFGLREEIRLSDVFSIYKFSGDHFEPQPLTLIEDENFVTDFTNLYKYYRESIFARFTKTENYLYMIFQTGKSPDDRKAFKWLIKGDQLVYMDDRSVHEVRKAPQHDFEWIRTDLSHRRLGLFPHVSILDKVFIEAMNGDVTFKIENNTDVGKGIYSEPVMNKDQQLDDAEYYYADLGNLIVIRIKPYQEDFRAFIFNVRTRQVIAIPTLLDAAVLLPDNQGLIFPNGYYLQNGEHKLFESDITKLEFVRGVASPNGEDFLYVFYQKTTNTYLLMSYNMIVQQVETPIICNGFALFDDGTLIYFRSEAEAVRHHQVQIWQTPYTAMLQENPAMSNNVLYKIGNKDIVSAMSECREVIQLLQKEDSYENLYEDIYKRTNDILDAYFWIRQEDTFNVAAPLSQIRETANTAVDEFAKVQAQRKHASDALKAMEKQVNQLVVDVKNASITSLDQLVTLLAATRSMQGGVIDLLNVRYMDTRAVNALKETLQHYNTSLSRDTVQFLLKEEALAPYEAMVAEQRQAVAGVTKVIEAQPVEEAVKGIAGGLEMLIDILNSLKIDDTTQTTRIVEKISLIFAALNEVKADLVRTTTALRSKESTGEFYAQLTLLDQSIVNFLDLSTSPEKCEDYFTKISVQVEELESRFADFEEFVLKIADKRDEVIKAFNGKKELLIAQINKRTSALEQIGLRVLKNIENKAQSFTDKESIYAFFSADLMIDKVRDLVEELKGMGDVAKAENLDNLLKVSRETALRSLKDKADLFADGQNVISLGAYKFVVNKQVLDLTIVRRNDRLFYHLIGTSFYKEVSAESLYRHRAIWEQELISENNAVYRAEYLAYQAFKESQLHDAHWDHAAFINDRTERDYAGAYLKGVHNTDAILIFQGLRKLQEELGILQFAPAVRVAAQLYWFTLDEAAQTRLQQLITAAYAIQQSFPGSDRATFVEKEIVARYQEVAAAWEAVSAEEVAHYLYLELSRARHFTCSEQALHLKKDFREYLQAQKRAELFMQEANNVAFSTMERFFIIRSWLKAFLQSQQAGREDQYLDEAVCLLLFSGHHYRERAASDTLQLEGLKGTHAVIPEGGRYTLSYHGFMQKMQVYFQAIVPAFAAFSQEKGQLVAAYRQQLKIKEFEPRVLSSFVRNRLISEVYFPLIGANLAKQIGAAGDDKRTARMGMLLLVSPPGYGKTTLMEYLAKTMGLHFVKINGPTIGHNITSIDPLEATTSGAREELKKINLSFEMADNVMLYIDDIQHCSPEFLQKFISLADGQRKMDGIFEGESKTYDLRGKRFCVVMAGNPYTESGEQFKIPDMLANRADVYNLGDVVGASDQLFKLSMIENSVAENSYLQRIASRSFEDLYKLVNYIEVGADLLPELEGNYNQQEIEDAIAVLKNVLLIRDIVMRVNQQYIASAAMKDAYRTEPPFKLQGSYRNMNKMAGKVVPLMNAEEVSTLIRSHYEGESQTLTSDAEANLLKLKEIAGLLTAEEARRWEQIREIFRKNNKFGGLEANDTSGQMLLQLSSFNEHLEAIAKAMVRRNA